MNMHKKLQPLVSKLTKPNGRQYMMQLLQQETFTPDVIEVSLRKRIRLPAKCVVYDVWPGSRYRLQTKHTLRLNMPIYFVRKTLD